MNTPPPPPGRRSPTEAMRLRPRATAAGAQVPPPEAVEAARRHAAPEPTTAEPVDPVLPPSRSERLEAVLAMHSASALVPYCLECYLPHPCPTWLAAAGQPATPTPPGDQSQ